MKPYARALLAIALVRCWQRQHHSQIRQPRLGGVRGHRQRRRALRFRLTEVSKASGISFVHEAPTLDGKRRTSCRRSRRWARPSPSPTSMPTGGRSAVTNSKEGSRNRLYRNRGDGTFEEPPNGSALPTSISARPACRWAPCSATTTTTGSRTSFSTSGAAGAVSQRCRDNGSRGSPTPARLGQHQHRRVARLRSRRPLDLFLGGYYPERVNLEARRHEDDAGELRVREQRRTQVPLSQSRTGTLRGGQREGRADVDALGARRGCRGPARHRLSDSSSPTTTACRSSSSTRVAASARSAGAGVGYAPKSGMNASVGDVLNQGKLAIYVSNISEEGILLQGNNLWVPTGGSSRLPTYENMARAMGIDLGGWSFGAQFGDLNNDGFLDLYLVNGYVSASRDESYWCDYSKVAGGHQLVIEDAANWPAMGHRSLAGYQPKKSGSTTGPAGSRRRTDGRRDRSPRRPLRRAGGLLRARGARRRGREPARPCCSTMTCAATGSGSASISKVGAAAIRLRRPAPTAAPSARRSSCSGTDASSCRKSRAAPASARRISGAALRPRVAHDDRSRGDPMAVRQGAGAQGPQAGRVHKIQEPA